MAIIGGSYCSDCKNFSIRFFCFIWCLICISEYCIHSKQFKYPIPGCSDLPYFDVIFIVVQISFVFFFNCSNCNFNEEVLVGCWIFSDINGSPRNCLFSKDPLLKRILAASEVSFSIFFCFQASFLFDRCTNLFLQSDVRRAVQVTTFVIWFNFKLFNTESR